MIGLLGPDLARNLVLKLQRIALPDGKPLKKKIFQKMNPTGVFFY